MTQGIITALLIVAFLGGTLWLWGSKRMPALDAAARLPLEDEAPATSADSKNR